MSSSRSRRFAVPAAAVALLLALSGSLGYLGCQRSKSSHAAPDMAAVLHANNTGVGWVEQFEYPNAVKAFREVVELAPEWTPGRINLGIALLNSATPQDLEEARQVFGQILDHEPDNPYAHFCLGIIMRHQGRLEEKETAAAHFQKVTQIDPRDAAAWYWYGTMLPEGSPEANEAFEHALRLNGSLMGAIYGLAMNLRQSDPARVKTLLDTYQKLTANGTGSPTDIKYTQMGHYADVIGHVPRPESDRRIGPLPLFAPSTRFQVKLAPGARWATAADLDKEPQGELRALLRARFGATLVVLDYNRDGKPDLFLAGSVVDRGQVRDLLLRNDGHGVFTDVTAEAGLAEPRPTVGCCVADYDNDGFPDLLLTGVGVQRLFRNTGRGKFQDVTALAGLDQLKTVCLGAAFVDLDQDGDLDLLIAQYGTPEETLSSLKGQGQATSGGLAAFINTGEARPVPAEAYQWTRGCTTLKLPSPALATRFSRARDNPGLLGAAAPAVGLAVSDVDNDRDLDALLVADHKPATVILNDRLLRFRRADLPESLVPSAAWNGALVFDVNHDQRSDALLIGPDRKPVLLINQGTAEPASMAGHFRPGVVESPPLLQAQAIDLDADGWTDVVGLSDEHQPVLLQNQGGKLVHVPEAIGLDREWPNDLMAVHVADFRGTHFADLLVWSQSGGLKLYENQRNGNHGLSLELIGRRATDGNNKLRCNADGFGVWVMAQADDLWTGAENTTLSAGLGQSSQPLLLGLGSHPQADIVRLRWPDNTWQAEFNLAANQMGWIEHHNRMTGSCPVLFAWNGERFAYVTDFLGAGSMGESQPDGGHRKPRPEESVKIEADQLVAQDGSYVLKIAEPMDEATYLDRLELQVLDLPPGVEAYPDERFAGAGPQPTQDLLVFRQQIFPVKATDQRGRDVTRILRQRDRDVVRSFAQRSWLGYAEEHSVELDFGDRLAGFGADDRLVLCLAGYTEYPYPQSIWAAMQAGVPAVSPALERRGADGRWQTVLADMGFPAGMPRMMTVPLTGKEIGGGQVVLRLRTNLEVYWDQIFVAPLVERIPESHVDQRPEHDARSIRITPLQVSAADLSARGYLQEYSPDGRQPTVFDHDRLTPVPYSQLAGRLTRFGDVTELLRQRDDRFVIFGPGDVVTVRFDATGLPPLPDGWKRSFVLRTWGYCKDCGPFTAKGATVEPLPFQRMSNYPYPPAEKYPDDAAHREYRLKFNTRQVGLEK
jgi:Flp pilus assembly protein TadD